MINTEYTHPLVEHDPIKKWDPFLQNDPPDLNAQDFYELTSGQTLLVGSSIEVADQGALESVIGELADLMGDENEGVGSLTGIEGEGTATEGGADMGDGEGSGEGEGESE